MRFIITLLAISLNISALFSQEVPLGSWTDHLPYGKGVDVDIVGNKIYCATESGLYYYDKNDNSIQRISKVNGLNDVGIKNIKYIASTKTLLVTYESGNLDLIKPNKIVNIPFIKNTNNIAAKQINNIDVLNEYAYLSCGFGIVKLNTQRDEISDSYIIGDAGKTEEVNDIVIYNDTIYAACEKGFRTAALNSNLTDFQNWKKSTFLNNVPYELLEQFNGDILTVRRKFTNNQDSIYIYKNGNWAYFNLFQTENIQLIKNVNKQLVIIENNKISFLDSNYTLVDTLIFYNGINGFQPRNIIYDSTISSYWISDFSVGLVSKNTTNYVNYKPNSPQSKNVFKIEAQNRKVYAVPGGYNGAYNSLFKVAEIDIIDNNRWKYLAGYNQNQLYSTFDLSNITIDPLDNEHVYIGTHGAGLIELNNDNVSNVFNKTNSAIPSRDADPNAYVIGGTTFDEEGNLWISNSYTTKALTVRKADGTWKTFQFPNSQVNDEMAADKVLISDAAHKWILFSKAGTNPEIVVFDDNGTIDNTNDDRSIKLGSAAGNGSLKGFRGICGAVDQDGEIWIGTDDGLFVFYNPSNIFNGDKDAQRILIDQNGVIEILLEKVRISDIKIDGANRKWIATEGQGVYLLSEDGTEEIHHFISRTSPLISDNVYGVTIDKTTGEVYFATELGIVSYKGDATDGFEDFSESVIYPNPVKPDYFGPIAIRGLVNNSIVKITDINGKIVNEIVSLGGQAIWNGKNFDGNRVQSGVYLVFSSSGDGFGNIKTNIGKIMFIK